MERKYSSFDAYLAAQRVKHAKPTIRQQQIGAAREAGKTYREIGQIFGISHGHAQQVANIYFRKKKWLISQALP